MSEETGLRAAQRVGDMAARDTGFDWEDPEGALDKVREEVAEVAEELARGDHAAALAELGDLLFAAAMVARKLGGDAEAALAASTAKFERRYVATLELLRERGVDPLEAELDVMEQAWQDVKRLGRATP
jgi:uncharacterized protein YabN with tetrapyrrole methylase and pyrophosphatase domain